VKTCYAVILGTPSAGQQQRPAASLDRLTHQGSSLWAVIPSKCKEILWATGTLIEHKHTLAIVRQLNTYFPCLPLWCSRTLYVAVGVRFTSCKSKSCKLRSYTLYCCILIHPANHHDSRPKTMNSEMLSWASWDFSGLELSFMHHIAGNRPC